MKSYMQESNILILFFEKCHIAVENGLKEVKKRSEETV